MRARALVATVLLLAGCNLPVAPWVRFTAYPVPYYGQADYEKRFSQWKSGNKAANWTLTYKATALSSSPLVIRSLGASSLGGLLPGTAGTGGEFTPTKAELTKLVDDLLASNLFNLYDGHYGAYDQGGGTIGPDLRFDVAGLEKHVSSDEDLHGGWEAEAIGTATAAVRALAMKYLSKKSAAK